MSFEPEQSTGTKGGPAFGKSSLSRRAFLFSTGLSITATLLPTAVYAAAAQSVSSGFAALSAFLTGKNIDPLLAGRAEEALVKVDASFAGKIEALRAFVTTVGAPDIDTLKNDPRFTGELRETAMTVISAYYVGFAGTPRPGYAEDNTVFITYTQALMYRLTYENTPIPSYSRWGTGYWTEITNPA